MAGKIFINYRREDTRSDAARVRDRLVAAFGKANVFMDVDNLMAGQRFDQQLAKALDECDVFLAVMGARWQDILEARKIARGRDYVREEIAEALARGLVVIPVLIERTPLPDPETLPEDIRALVLHQKHDVGHERFGRDVDDLVAAIKAARKVRASSRRSKWPRIAAGILSLGLIVAGVLYGYTMLRTDPQSNQTEIVRSDPAAPVPAPPVNAAAVAAPPPASMPSPEPPKSPAPDVTTASGGVGIADMPPNFTDTSHSATSHLPSAEELAELTRKIQAGLRDAGCLAVEPNGKWGPKTKAAAIRFNEYAKKNIATDAPADSTLTVLGNSARDICPIDCKPYEDLRGHACVEKSCPDGQELWTDAQCAEIGPGRKCSDCSLVHPGKTAAVAKKYDSESLARPIKRGSVLVLTGSDSYSGKGAWAGSSDPNMDSKVAMPFLQQLDDELLSRASELGLDIRRSWPSNAAELGKEQNLNQVNRNLHWRINEDRVMVHWMFFDADGEQLGLVMEVEQISSFGLEPKKIGHDDTSGALKKRLIDKLVTTLRRRMSD